LSHLIDLGARRRLKMRVGSQWRHDVASDAGKVIGCRAGIKDDAIHRDFTQRRKVISG
jgi:hypothetical protein